MARPASTTRVAGARLSLIAVLLLVQSAGVWWTAPASATQAGGPTATTLDGGGRSDQGGNPAGGGNTGGGAPPPTASPVKQGSGEKSPLLLLGLAGLALPVLAVVLLSRRARTGQGSASDPEPR